jgi:hypothetical protein
MTRIYKEEIEPLLSSKPGVRGFGYLIKPDGEALVMSMWDSKEHANAPPQKRYYEKILARLGSIAVGALTHDEYELPAVHPPQPTQMIISRPESSFDQYFRRFTGQWPDERYRAQQKLYESTREQRSSRGRNQCQRTESK